MQASDWNPRDLPHDSKRTLAAGSVVQLTIYYRVTHTGGSMPGWVEARLCTDGNSLTQQCFDQNRLQAYDFHSLLHDPVLTHGRLVHE